MGESISLAAELSPDVVPRLSPDRTVPGRRLPSRDPSDSAQTKLIFPRRVRQRRAGFAALEAGASAFIHKSRAASEVVDAIRTVAGGGTLITPRTIAALLNKRRSMDAQLESLTPREKEVLRLMAEGVSSREIASKLGISYTTVRTHIRSLGAKLGVHSKLQAIVKARELALVE